MKILLVEDEKVLAEGIQAILEKEGYRTDVVYDGLSGLDYILSDTYDLVLLDIVLPKLNGIDVLKNARADGVTIPIILLSARGGADDKILGLDSGADDYLVKPFDAGELLARIRVRIRERSAEGRGTTGLVIGNIRLDQSTYKLFGEEKSVKLSNKEYQLLEYLMLNGGKILSRDMIISRVWGTDSDADYNNLEVFISFVRKKLKYVESSASIITTKGVGYSIEVI